MYMASEPEKKIEHLLRAYGQKRREDAGAPLEMHPATRRMLQGEVARQKKGAPKERPWWMSFFLMSPKLAGVVGLFAIVAVGGWVIYQSERKPGPVSTEVISQSEMKAPAEPLLADDRVATADSKQVIDETAQRNIEESAGKALKKAEGFRLEPRAGDEVKAPSLAQNKPAPTATGQAGLADVVERERVAARSDQPMDKLALNLKRESLAVTDKEINERTPANGRDLSDMDRFSESSDVQTGRKKFTELGASVLAASTPITAGLQIAVAPVGQVVTNVNYFAYSIVTNAPAGSSGGVLMDFAKTQATNIAPAQEMGAALGFGTQTEWAAAAPTQTTTTRAVQIEPGRAAAPSGAASAVAVGGVAAQAEQREVSGPLILQRFTIEQANQRIRIRDQDGSIYEGEVLATIESKEDTAVAVKSKAKDNRGWFEGQQGGLRSFRASGMSRNLGQPVVIQGAFFDEQERLSEQDVSLRASGAIAPAPAISTSAPAATAPQNPASVRVQASPPPVEKPPAELLYRRAELPRSSTVRGAAGTTGTSGPVALPRTLRARVQIGSTNVDLNAVRTR
jgi:hypothetical protein